MSVLVIDVGTTGLRAAIVRHDGTVADLRYERCPPTSPFPGLVEFDASAIAQATLRVASAVLSTSGPVDAVGITTQRASTVIWDARTLAPLGPALGWQDLRTVGDCMVAKAEHGLALAPNQSATKAKWLLETYAAGRDRSELCIGTVDSWVAWTLSGESCLHVTDHSNAAVTGLATMHDGAPHWNARAMSAMGIDPVMLPTIVSTSGEIGRAHALPGAPIITSLVGDQQGSLMGQSCVRPGMAKCTFGTGGMLDLLTGQHAPASPERTAHGTFPIVAWSIGDSLTWGAESIMLSAGSCVEWLRDDMGLIDSAEESHLIAGSVTSSDDVYFVPALLGMATPQWDYGARGALLGLTRGSTRAHVVRAVLEGVAHRGADLLDAALADHPSLDVDELRIDGGMSRNPTFVAALATAIGRPVAVSPVTEATTLGAAFLAGLAVGTWASLDDVAAAWRPQAVIEPDPGVERSEIRARWAEAVTRSTGWIPALSALDF